MKIVIELIITLHNITGSVDSSSSLNDDLPKVLSADSLTDYDPAHFASAVHDTFHHHHDQHHHVKVLFHLEDPHDHDHDISEDDVQHIQAMDLFDHRYNISCLLLSFVSFL